MTEPALRRDIEAALEALDDAQAFERLVFALLEPEWIVQRIGSPTHDATDDGLDFLAWHPNSPEIKYGGEICHVTADSPVLLTKLRNKIQKTRRTLRARGTHPGRLLFVTSAPIEWPVLSRSLRPRKSEAHPLEEILYLNRKWMVEKLSLPRNSHLLKGLDISRHASTRRPDESCEVKALLPRGAPSDVVEAGSPSPADITPLPPDEAQEATRAARRRRKSAGVSPDADLQGHAPPGHPRYVTKGVLGRGGQGIVFRVHDRDLGRDVALKTLPVETVSQKGIELFLREAGATALLEHPNIVPIHDVGRLEDGRPFYTMRLMPGRSFREVLERLRALEIDGSDDPDWSLTRLLQVVQQACLALQFAHERGIVHRDVKPANILLGAHGEVLLVDWGISRLVEAPEGSTAGVGIGTPQYMSPEQAIGNAVDARTDVYSAGVMLYECLSLRLPHELPSGAELIAAVLRDEPEPPERRTRRHVPPELSRLTRLALSKKPGERLSSARELHEALQQFIEGVADRARRMREAERLTSEGEELLRRHEETLLQSATTREEIASLSRIHPAWEPVPERRPLLLAQRKLEELEARSRAEMLQAVHRLTDALAHAQDHAVARARLADTFLTRLRESELLRDEGMSLVWHSLVERFHDGRHARELAGRGSIRVALEPAGASWRLHRLVEGDVALADGPVFSEGTGDVVLDDVEMGSWVLVARADGCEPARYPIAIFRNTEWTGQLSLLPAGSLPEGFIHVPGTETWLGGDPAAIHPSPLRRARVESFAIARYPVTFREWCDFLDALPLDHAERRVPKTESMGRLCERIEGRWEPTCVTKILAPWTKERWGQDCAWRVPVFGVCLQDAEDYCAFLSEQIGRTVRLPTPDEWELAARGVDRRTYPWGNRFDATACHCRESSGRQPDVAPVGAAELDCSVYGVGDMGGGMHQVTSGWLETTEGMLEVRGGGWQASSAASRCASRHQANAGTRTSLLGIRVIIQRWDAEDSH